MQRNRAEARQQAWNTMRVMRRFTVADICTTAAIGKSNARKYVKALLITDFLVVAKPHVSGRPGSLPLYQLIRDTGPKAPTVRRDGASVHDWNTGDTWLIQWEDDVRAVDGAAVSAASSTSSEAA